MLDFDNQVLGSLHGSDHYPIKLKLTETIFHLNYPIRYKTEKADWTTFRNKTSFPPNHLDGNEAIIDEQVQAMCSIILSTLFALVRRCLLHYCNEVNLIL